MLCQFDIRLLHEPERVAAIEHVEYLREAGSEGIEMVMWLVMRGALGEALVERHRHYHVPCSNTAIGHLILEKISGAARPESAANPR